MQGARLGGAGGEGEAFVGFDGHGLDHEVGLPDGGVADVLDAGAVQANVMGCRPGWRGGSASSPVSGLANSVWTQMPRSTGDSDC